MKNKSRYKNLFLRRSVLLSLLVTFVSVCIYAQDKVSIAFITDLHVNPLSASDSALQEIVNDINNSGFDFTIVGGDLTNTGSDAELNAVKKALSSLKKPCYVIPGNHETNWSESAGLTFNRLWGDDRFFFRYGRFVLVGFNTGPYMRMGDGLVKQEDLSWLKRKLAAFPEEESVLLSFSHYPLSDGLSNWPEVTATLKSAGCRIAFCGHGHRLSLHNFNGIPGIMGRAVLTGDPSAPGYNIIRIAGDSVSVYNKLTGSPAGEPSICFSYTDADTIDSISISPLPDYSVNNQSASTEAITLVSDTASIFTGPCLVNDTIIIYTNAIGWVKAISTPTGSVLWQTRIEGPVYSTPLNCRGIIVLGSVDGLIYGINAINGAIAWKINAKGPVLAEGIAEGRFVYIGGNKAFYKIDAQKGSVMWSFTSVDDLVQGAPALSGKSVFFGAWDRHLYSLDKKKGVLNWKWNNGKPQKLYSPGNITPVCSANKVFIVAPDRYMTALDAETGKELWRTNRHQVRESMGVSPDGSLVYAKLMNDTLIAVSVEGDKHSTLWAVNAGFGYEHNPCPVTATDKAVIAATRAGMLVAVDPEQQRVIWKFKVGNSSVNKVVDAGNGLFWFTLMEGKVMSVKYK